MWRHVLLEHVYMYFSIYVHEIFLS